jgi:hypothetical protein
MVGSDLRGVTVSARTLPASDEIRIDPVGAPG